MYQFISKNEQKAVTDRQSHAGQNNGGADLERARNESSVSPTIFRRASCSCGGGCPACQSKSALNISQPDDPAEIEADQMADRVMRMPNYVAGESVSNGVRAKSPRTETGPIFRKSEAVDRVEEKRIHRKLLPSSPTVPDKSPGHVREVLGGRGQSLDLTTRRFFESGLGYDLGSVRIHTGPLAAASAQAISAKAYTFGNDIVFGERQFEPNSFEGKRLLAHELAHVVQHHRASSPVLARQPAKPVAGADDKVAVSRVENEDGTWSALNSRGTILKTGQLGKDIDPVLPNLYQTIVVGERDRKPQSAVGVASSSCPVQFTDVGIGIGNETTPITRRPEYIDNAMDRMLYGIYLGGFVLYLKGTDKTIFVSNRFLTDREESRSVGDCIYRTVEEAKAGVVAYSKPDDRIPRHAYYWGGGGDYIVPDVFSNATTPRIMATLFEARKELARQVQHDLTGVATGMIISKGMSFAYGKARSAFTGDPAPPANTAPPVQNIAPGPTTKTAPASQAPPKLEVIQGGGQKNVVPPATTPQTTQPSAVYTGPGGAAPKLAPDVLPSQPPVRHLQSVPMPPPLVKPDPGPIFPPTALNRPLGTYSGPKDVGAFPRPIPFYSSRPDVDRDNDKEQKRGACRYQSIAQQTGRYPCHAAYATMLSGVSREVRVQTPEGWSIDFDAIDFGQTLYEVKTGYRWLVFMASNEARADVINRFYLQATEQLLIAERCGHPLRWYFNDPYVASFFGAENAPYPDYFQVGLPVPVWYVPYDCNQDSG